MSPSHPDPSPDPDPVPAPTYTIDQLEAARGVPVRTIRLYRRSGLISSPGRIGHLAFYDAESAFALEIERAVEALLETTATLDVQP